MLLRPPDIYSYGDWNYRGVCAKEYQEARVFVSMVRYQYPKYQSLIAHMRNESGRGKTKWQVYQEKKEGMVVGHADFVLGGVPTGYIELKRRNPSMCKWEEGQLEFLREAKARGCFVAVALGADAALEAFRKWLAYSAKMEAALVKAGFVLVKEPPIVAIGATK